MIEVVSEYWVVAFGIVLTFANIGYWWTLRQYHRALNDYAQYVAESNGWDWQPTSREGKND